MTAPKKSDFKKRMMCGVALGLNTDEAQTLAHLDTPEKIQDFITRIPINFEEDGETALSVRQVLAQNRCHCIEGAFVAACALMMAGRPALVMDFKASGDDTDHVVALFRAGKYWGAISKSNHIWLRWRDPVYASLRELAMSYFHEYVRENKKTLRSYSAVFDIGAYDPKQWVTSDVGCWDIAQAIDESRHFKLITDAQAKNLRPRDKFETQAGRLTEHGLKGRRFRDIH